MRINKELVNQNPESLGMTFGFLGFRNTNCDLITYENLSTLNYINAAPHLFLIKYFKHRDNVDRGGKKKNKI